jgi:DNA-binding CsgD family transcriptional regulator
VVGHGSTVASDFGGHIGETTDEMSMSPGTLRDAMANQLAEAAGQLDRGLVSAAVRSLRGLGPDVAATPAARLLLATALVVQARDVEAGALVAGLMDRDDLESSERALARAITAHVRAVVDDPARGRELAQQVLEIPEASAVARSLARLTISRSHLFEGDLLAAHRAAHDASAAAAGTPLPIRVDTWLLEAYVAFQADRFDAARELIIRIETALADAPAEDGTTASQAERARHARGALRFHLADWDGIEALLDPRAGGSVGAEVSDAEWATMAGLLLVVLVHRDQLADAATLAAEATAVLASGQRPLLLWGSLLLAECRADLPATAGLAERLLSTIDQLRSPISFRTMGPDLVRVLLVVGDRPAAAEIADRLEAVAGRAGVRSVTSAAALCHGLVTGDADALRAAAAGYAETGRRLEEATALEALAAVSDDRAAAAAGRRALSIYGAIGARRDDVRLAAALRARGIATTRRGRPPRGTSGWARLSTTEERVARLIADGLTNTEIGRQLAISPRTVETHVTHVLNKLGVSGRAAVAAIAARNEV